MIEVPVFSVESAMAAIAGGAGRLEVCGGFCEGGITPSFGLVTLIKEKANVPVHVMIRPRGGDFLYSEYEFEIMKRDIMHCRSIGVEGVVFGILLPDGNVDEQRCKLLVEFARPMSVTFHRAFDRSRDPYHALSSVTECGFDRLLTSGQMADAARGADLIAELIRESKDKIIIMPGAGIDEHNIGIIAKTTGASEFHLSGKVKAPGLMEFTRKGININTVNEIHNDVQYVTSAKKIAAAKEVLTSLIW